MSNFLDSLSIDGVGEKTSKDLSKKFKTLNNLISCTEEDLLSIKDIGGIIAKNIVNYFSNKQNLEEIDNLLNCGVKIEEVTEKNIDKSNIFYNKKVVLTGSLNNYTRSEASKIIEDMGGEVVSSVSKNTNFVLVGLDAGSKLDKAKALNIPLLSEEDFEKIVNKN